MVYEMLRSNHYIGSLDIEKNETVEKPFNKMVVAFGCRPNDSILNSVKACFEKVLGIFS